MLKNLALRAVHTFWQAFTAVFAGAFVASAANYHVNAQTAMTSVSGAERFGLAVAVAAGAAALSGVKTTAQNYRAWSGPKTNAAHAAEFFQAIGLAADGITPLAPNAQPGATPSPRQEPPAVAAPPAAVP